MKKHSLAPNGQMNKRMLLNLVFVFATLFHLSASDIFVATTGNDGSGNGSIGTPYLTIQKAASVAGAGDVVQVRAGTYRETITPANSGNAGSPITFQPYNGESVTISGADVISTTWTVSSGNIYKATMSNTFFTNSHNQSDQIFVDGAMMSIARWPNNASLDPSYPTKSTLSGQSTSKTLSGNTTTVVFNAASNPPSDAAGAEIYVQPDKDAWSWTLTGQVQNISGSTVTLTSYNSSGSDGKGGVYNNGSRFYIFNKLSLLDAAGEWFHDKSANLLYLWCPANAVPSTKLVEAKKREFAFNLSNKNYITIKGFTLFACAITTDSESGGSNQGYDGSGNIIYPWRGAGYVASSSNCVVDGLTAKYLSHYTDCSGHFFMQWGQSSGIVMSGSDHLITNCNLQYSAGNGITLMGQRCKALNNMITDMDYNSTDCSGINTGGTALSDDHEIGYNTITRTGRSSITPRALKNSSTSNFTARIHHNDLSHYLLQDWDGGGIYASNNGGFTRIDHNVVHDGTPGFTCGGIYLDWSKNYIIDHNVVYNVEWGIHLQESSGGSGTSNMICYNNTVVVKNTSGVPYGPFGFASTASAPTQNGTICQNNINVYRDGSSTAATAGYRAYSLGAFDNATKSNNLDHPSVPSFTNFGSGDLTLLTGSPAINAGAAMNSVSLDGYNIPAYNDPTTGTMDIGAYEFGQPKWTAGYTVPSGATVPSAPTTVVATGGSTQATVSFTAPANNGGSAITGYTVTSSPGGITKTGTSSPLTVTGLTNGTPYTFTVKATNVIGSSAASAASNSVTPTAVATVPGAPTSVTATAGNAQASVAFTAPANNGGSAITGYTVTSSPGGITKTGTSSPLTVTGLTNGTPYTFTVKATNAIGSSVASAASSTVTPSAAGTTYPLYTSDTASDWGEPASQAFDLNTTTNWSQPTTTGWIQAQYASAVGYNAYSITTGNEPNANFGRQRDLKDWTIQGSNNGTSWTVLDTRTNQVWIDPTTTNNYTFSNATTYSYYRLVFVNNGNAYTQVAEITYSNNATVPGAPTSVIATAGNAQASVAFTAPASNGGSAITGYTVTSNPGGLTATGATSPLTITGLTNGTPYIFTVKATNAIGTSVASAASASATPIGGIVAAALWHFDSNTNATPTTYNGTAVGTPTYTAGKTNNALTLNGTSQYVTTPTVINPGTTNFTANAWVKYASLYSTALTVLQQGNGTGTGRGWLWLNPGDAHIASTIGGTNNYSTSALSAGTWYMVSVSYSAGTVKLYVNGVLETTASATAESADGGMFIGCNKNINAFWSGSLDEVSIYNSALSDTQIASLYSTGVVTVIESPINGESQGAMRVYPNPATDNLNLNFGSELERAVITIQDLQGRSVMTRSVANTAMESLNVSSLNAGIYFVKVVVKNEVLNSRFIKR